MLKRIDFSNDSDMLCQFVDAVKKTNGGDPPECYELVLHDAQSLSWTFSKKSSDEEETKDSKTDTMKALVIIGDQMPHEFGGKDVKHDWNKELDALKVFIIPACLSTWLTFLIMYRRRTSMFTEFSAAIALRQKSSIEQLLRSPAAAICA